MKFFIAMSLLSLSLITFAEDDAKFADHKKIMVENLSQQISVMQSTKSCIESASNHEAVKKCHEASKAERTKLESQRIDENIKRLEEKKKTLLDAKKN
jgi:hypothetical protein